MITNILIGLLVYSVVVLVLLVGWHRHCVRMDNYDKAMRDATGSDNV